MKTLVYIGDVPEYGKARAKGHITCGKHDPVTLLLRYKVTDHS